MTNIYLPQPPRVPDAQLTRWFIEIWKKLGVRNAVLGAFRFGDADNNTQIEDDGTLVFNGDATVWNDINSAASNLKPGVTQPTWGSIGTGGLYGYRFSPTQVQELHGSSELLHDYKEGSNISVHIHWSPTTTNVGNIVWGIEYKWVNPNTAFPSTTTIYTTTTTTGTAWVHKLNAFSDITGTGKTIGSAFIYRIFRDATNVADTYTGDAYLCQLGIHYEIDTVGSRGIYTK